MRAPRAAQAASLRDAAAGRANDPDLRAFEAHGGKLIIYHGWADQAIPPWSTIDYYAAVERTTGGFRYYRYLGRY